LIRNCFNNTPKYDQIVQETNESVARNKLNPSIAIKLELYGRIYIDMAIIPWNITLGLMICNVVPTSNNLVDAVNDSPLGTESVNNV
jgi:hypothetical protein